MDPRLSRIVIVSAILHLLFISFVAVPIKTKTRDLRIYSVRLIGQIELPEGKIETQTASKMKVASQKAVESTKKSPKEPALPIPKPAPKVDMTLEEIERVKKEIERLHAISTLSKKLEQEKQEKEKQRLREAQIMAKKALEKPIEISGTSEEVNEGDTTNEGEFYGNIIKQRIEQHWVYHGFKTSGLSAIVSIRIKKDGKIILEGFETSSGDTLFDRSILKALAEASPLPPPPQGDIEIGLVFTP